MRKSHFTQGIRPGGLTSSAEIRILICYLLDQTGAPISREQIEDALLGEELVNYFALSESLAAVAEQGLVVKNKNLYEITEAGRTVGRTLSRDVPKSVRDLAVRGVIRSRQYAARKSTFLSEIHQSEGHHEVHCTIQDAQGALFSMQLYMPDNLSAKAVEQAFVAKGDAIYGLVLAALTQNPKLAEQYLAALSINSEQ